MKKNFLIPVLLLATLFLGFSAWWTLSWMKRDSEISPHGGLWWPDRQVLPVPHFLQEDTRWGKDLLGATEATLASEGCAVAAAAMVLNYHGADTDPGQLNEFLTDLEGGYTPSGWIYWEKAAEIDPELSQNLLPHYEDDASHALIDWNLLRGNPAIVRLRYPNGITHFVVVIGKEGFRYLILDPGRGGVRGLYPLDEFDSNIEALRFYKRPQNSN